MPPACPIWKRRITFLRLTPFARILERAYARWSAEDGDQRAAAIAYYLLLSILPLILLLVSVGSLFVEQGVAIQSLFAFLDQYTILTEDQEEAAVLALLGMLEVRGGTSLAAFGFLVWGSMRFLHALIRSTNRVWDVEKPIWWRLSLRSLALLATTTSAVLFGVLLPLAAAFVRRRNRLFPAVPDWTFSILIHFIPWIVLFYGFMMLYKLAPGRSTRLSDVWFGALVSTALIWACSRLFLIYLENFANFNVLYGTLGGAMAFLLWLYLSCNVCVFGVCLCAAHADVGGKPAFLPEEPTAIGRVKG